MSTILLSIAAISFYMLATFLLALCWQRGTSKTADMPAGGAIFPASIALLLHALLAGRYVWIGGGLNFNVVASLVLFAWVTTLIAVLIGLNTRLRFLGLIMFPISMLCIIGALILPDPSDDVSHRLNLALEAHIFLSVIAYCLLSIAALLAIVLAAQDYQLHHHKEGLMLKNMPPLQTVEKLLFRLIAIGFVLLTFSLISGFAFAKVLFNRKILFSLIAWTVFLVLLLGRYFAGWRGKIAIRWTLGGIVALMLAFFGTKVVLEYILK